MCIIDSHDSFFGFNKAIESTNCPKTNSAFIRALQAADKLNISINVIDDNFDDTDPLAWIIDAPAPNFSLKAGDDEETIINAKKFLSSMNKTLKSRYQAGLSMKEFRCHSFTSLKNSKLSNFFIGNHKAPTSDNLVMFALQARTNSLLTEEVQHKRSLSPSDKCRACGANITGSLMHRLNKCNASMTKITRRHNEIAHIISSGLKDMWGVDCPPLNENATIFIPDFEQLPDRSRRLKPDIWFVRENPRTRNKTVNIIEITCPYGMLTDTPDGRKSSLEIRENDKLIKYSSLIDDIKSSWNIDATLFIIVISSLGAITKSTEKTLKKLFITKERSNLIAKRCVMAAIRGSYAIFYGKDLNRSLHIAPSQVTSDYNDITSSGHLTDEEDGDILNSQF